MRAEQNSLGVEPPWVKYPGYSPSDGFWRQSGETWFAYVWQPYWNNLCTVERQDYLERWNAPEQWRLFYFSPDFSTWLNDVDDE